MPNQLAHFAIHADDLERARKFYGSVFGWKFRGHGGPRADFRQMQNASANKLAPLGALFSPISVHQSLRGFHG
jgi:predicted enzyme related to lactoylglutathione lyase